jgi:hypothetical protein
MINIHILAKLTIGTIAIISIIPLSQIDAFSRDRDRISQHRSIGIDISKIEIAGIRYGMTERAVLRKLGNPRSTKVSSNCLGSIDRLFYPGLRIDLETRNRQKYVTWIQVTGTGYRMNSGVKIGDPIAKAVKIYDPTANLLLGRILTIRSDRYGDLFLRFEADRLNRITQISIVFEC